jgi:hypothetical protein
MTLPIRLHAIFNSFARPTNPTQEQSQKSAVTNALFLLLQTVLLFLKFFGTKETFLWFADYFQSNDETPC